MSHLTQEQIDRLTGLMDERYDREIEEINAIAARTHDERRQEALGSRAADQVDSVLAQIVRASDYARVQQDIEDVRDIIGARKRLADGVYGICIDCDAEIRYVRLLAYPTAKRCIDCQREHEAARQA